MFLEISQLRVQYPGRSQPAVDGVSLSLQAGEIGVLIGPSGCGKTTLLRSVAGLERAQGGTISLAQSLVSSPSLHIPAENRRIGMVFQDYALFPHLSVAQNVGFGLMHLKNSAQRSARIAEVLALVGLESAGNLYPHQLSGGQQQRVALARALAPRPRLLLLDEPFSSLDVDLRERLAHEVRAILKAAGATALLVTHDQLEAFAIGDTIGVMQNGRLHQWDAAYALYHRPATRFVADFIGHGVFAKGRMLKQSDQGVVVETALGLLSDIRPWEQHRTDAAHHSIHSSPPAHADDMPDYGESGLCDVLLRADDIVHDDAAPTKARIVRKSFRGSEFLYTLELATGEPLLAHVPSHHDHAIGEWIGIRAEVEHVVTFARENA